MIYQNIRIQYYRIANNKFIDFWNVVQVFSIVFFFVGFGLRLVPDMECYLAARVVLSLDALLWFFRSLHAYSFIRSLGPKIVMIREMLSELFYFISIVLVFIFAYGVSTQSLMYHNQELSFDLLKNVFYPAYFLVVGDFYEREKIMDRKLTFLHPFCINLIFN